jgi:uncharacterized protein YndB with AHSA1/START domain
MSGETVTVVKTIDALASKVWAALTTPETIKRYFFGSFCGVHDGKRYEDKGEIH